MLEKIVKKSKVTHYKLIADLECLETIKEVSTTQQNKFYVLKDYLDLFKNK